MDDFFNEGTVYVEMVQDFLYTSVRVLQLNNTIHSLDNFEKIMGITIGELITINRLGAEDLYFGLESEFLKNPVIKEV